MNEELQPVDQTELVRELARRAYPDAVAELIDGGSAEEVAASIEPARAAFARLKEQIEAGRPMAVSQVPAGGMSPAIDPDRLPSAEKIRRGLRGRSTLTRS